MTAVHADTVAADPTRSELGFSGEDDEVHTRATLAFAAWLDDRHYAPATIRVYTSFVERLLAHLYAAGIMVEDATVEDIYGFWRTVPSSSASRNQARKAAIALFKSLGRRRGEPAADLPAIPDPDGVPRPVTVSDFALITAAARRLGGIHQVIGLTLAYTGCRITELRTARWAKLELLASAPQWRIEGKGSGRRGPKPRVVPIRPALVPVLTAWRAECGSSTFLFPSGRSSTGVVADGTMRRYVYQITEAAGLDRVVPHRFRHTVGTNALALTNDLRGVQELLGHSSLSTTQRYTQVLPGRLVDMVGLLPD